MEGILHESQNLSEYCWQLLLEYSVLDTAQIFGLLKQNGVKSKRERERIARSLRHRGLTRRLTIGDRTYYTKNPQIKPTGKYMAQIRCFWILLQYIGRVDSHHAAGTFSRITMEIDGRDYDIVYVPEGAERLCLSHIRRGGDTRYFVVVEDVSQIPLLQSEKIHTYATVSEQGEVEYYAGQ